MELSVDTLLSVQQPMPEVSVLDLAINDSAIYQNPLASYYAGDIARKEDVLSVLRKTHPQVVFHMASPPHTGKPLELYIQVNVDGTRNLLECSQELGVKCFVYTSSASVIHDASSDLFLGDESFPLVFLPKQKEVYSHTKALADRLVLDANLKNGNMMTVSLRPSGIFGEGDIVVKSMVTIAQEGKYKFQIGDGKNLFDWTYVGNVVDAHLLAGEALLQESNLRSDTPYIVISDEKRVNGEAFIVTNDEPIPFWDFARGIGAAGGHPTNIRSIRKIPRSLGLVIGFLAEWIVWITSFGRNRSTFSRFTICYSTMTRTYRIDKIKSRLGYRPKVSMKDAISRAGGSFLGKMKDV